MSNVAYRNGLFDGDKNHVLNQYDMRIMGAEHEGAGRVEFLTSYLRGELSYNTDIAYTGLEDGYMPLPGPARRSTGERFVYNHVDITPEAIGADASWRWAAAFATMAAERHAYQQGPERFMWLPADTIAEYVRGQPAHERQAWSRTWLAFYASMLRRGHMMYRDQRRVSSCLMILHGFLRTLPAIDSCCTRYQATYGNGSLEITTPIRRGQKRTMTLQPDQEDDRMFDLLARSPTHWESCSDPPLKLCCTICASLSTASSPSQTSN